MGCRARTPARAPRSIGPRWSGGRSGLHAPRPPDPPGVLAAEGELEPAALGRPRSGRAGPVSECRPHRGCALRRVRRQQRRHEVVEVSGMLDQRLQIRAADHEAPAVLAFPGPGVEVHSATHHEGHARRAQPDQLASHLVIEQVTLCRVDRPDVALVPRVMLLSSASLTERPETAIRGSRLGVLLGSIGRTGRVRSVARRLRLSLSRALAGHRGRPEVDGKQRRGSRFESDSDTGLRMAVVS